MNNNQIDIHIDKPTIEQKEESSTLCSSTKNVLYWMLIFLLFVDNIATGIYECYMGGQSAKLIANYYDYSENNVSIDAYPRDIYKNTKQTATIMLLFGAFGLVCALIGSLVSIYNCNKEYFMFGSVVGNMSVIVIPFCFSSFLTWKLNSLSEKDINTWNNIDVGFVDNLHNANALMWATLIPGICWVIIGCVIMCSQK
jgi:hypothetical protein